MHPFARPRVAAMAAVLCLIAVAIAGALGGTGPGDPPPAAPAAPARAPAGGPRPALGGLFVPGFWSAPAAGAGVTLWLRNPGGRDDAAKVWHAAAGAAPKLLETVRIAAGASLSFQPGVDLEPGVLYVEPADPGTRLEGVATIVRVAEGGAKRVESVPAQPVVPDAARGRLLFPVLHHANGQTGSLLTVTNTSRAARELDVRVTYRAPDGTRLTTESARLPWLGSFTASFGAADEHPELDGHKVFSAELRADGAIAAVAESDDGAILLASEGLSPAGRSRPAPLVMANNGGTSTAVQLQSAGDRPARVRVAYAPNQATAGQGGPVCAQPRTAAVTIPPHGTASVVQSGDAGDPGYDGSFRGCLYIGSARITADQAVVAVVTQLGPDAGSAYATPERFGEHEVTLPLVQSTGAVLAGIQVQFERKGPGELTLVGGPNAAGERPCAIDRVQVRIAGPLILPGPAGPFAGCDYAGPLRLRDPGTRFSAVLNQLSPAAQGWSDGLASLAAAQ